MSHDIRDAVTFFKYMSPATRAKVEQDLRELFWSWATATAMGYTADNERILGVYDSHQKTLNQDLGRARLEVFVQLKLP
jgi:hypothetical protein